MRTRALKLLLDARRTFCRHDGSLMAAAIAFYSMIAAAPLLVISVVVAGAMFGEHRASAEILAAIEANAGGKLARYVGTLVQSAREARASTAATLVAVVIVLVASLRLFERLRAAINRIWGIRLREDGRRGWRVWLNRLAIALLVCVFGAWVLLLIASKTAIAALSAGLDRGHRVTWIWHLAEGAVSVLAFALLVAMILKLLPDARLAWRDALRGGLATSLLLSVGVQLLGFYLAFAGPTSVYGAAGVGIVALLWLYYSVMILLYGAALTAAWAEFDGRAPRPLDHAERTSVYVESVSAP